MAEVEEVQFHSLAERIAALKRSGLGTASAPHSASIHQPARPVIQLESESSQRRSLSSQASTFSLFVDPAVSPSPGHLCPPLPSRPPSSPPSSQSCPVDPEPSKLPPLPPRTYTPQPTPSRAFPPSRSPAASPALPPRPASTSLIRTNSRSNPEFSGRLATPVTSSLPQLPPRELPPRKLPPSFDSFTSSNIKRLPLLRSPPQPSSDKPQQVGPVSRVLPPILSFPSAAHPSRPAVFPSLASRESPALTSDPGSSTLSQHPPHLVHHEPVSVNSTSLEPLAQARRLPPPPKTFVRSSNTIGSSKAIQTISANTLTPSPSANRPPPIPSLSRDSRPMPPPVPVTSRPSHAELDAAAERLSAQISCLVCRDFYAPDEVASRYPRSSLPNKDPVGYLAHNLCGPFASLTDKARAIFAWFYHNIAYDTDAFFGNRISSRSPEHTISYGAAVCSGYADTYKAIAERAGLECVVVTGHGKGYGFTALGQGQSVPPATPDGHAWNAVRIDGGQWKLSDACWGAGSICDAAKRFKQHFSPHEFTAPNDIFGLRHFPNNPDHFFRPDGRVPTWAEYYRGPSNGAAPVTVYGPAAEEGVLASSVLPTEGDVAVRNAASGTSVRFGFCHPCEHWTTERNGGGQQPALFLFSMNGRGGDSPEIVPLETDGFWFWIDVPPANLGRPGQEVSIVLLTTLDGKSARGITKAHYLSRRGKCAMAWSGISKWTLT